MPQRGNANLVIRVPRTGRTWLYLVSVVGLVGLSAGELMPDGAPRLLLGYSKEQVEAASFAAMKSQGHALLPEAQQLWNGGAGRFLNKGTNGRWPNRLAATDLACYHERVRLEFPPELARWLEHGRLVAGDPRAL